MAVFDPDHGWGFRSRLTPNYSSSGLGCNCGAPSTLVPPTEALSERYPEGKRTFGAARASLLRHRGRIKTLSRVWAPTDGPNGGVADSHVSPKRRSGRRRTQLK